jgi:hypothetical protein
MSRRSGAACHEDLVWAANALQAKAADSLIVAGRGVSGSPTPDGGAGRWWVDAPDWSGRDAGPEQDPEVALGALIYQHCYLRPSPRRSAQTTAWGDREFESALAQPNIGSITWEHGWSWHSATDGGLTVSRAGVRFRVTPEEVRPFPPVPGQACSVRVPAERRNLMPGYYLLAGNEEWDLEPSADGGITRVYWHLRSAGGPALVPLLARCLNAAAVPFRLKVPTSPAAYTRADAGVLYLPMNRYAAAQDAVRTVHAAMRDHLRDEVPLFTKRLAPGLGLAEDPGNGLSFGQHRCRLVARGLWAAHQIGEQGPEDRLRAIVGAFRAEGLDAEHPYLSQGSVDDYDRLANSARRTTRDATTRGPRREAGSAESAGDPFLAAAVRIGEDLCSAALWDSNRKRCSWLGRSNDGFLTGRSGGLPRTASLGPAVYDGLCGVALFLSELFRCTGHDPFQQTARGAVDCAVHLVQMRRDRTGDPGKPGFYTGLTGVALAALHVVGRSPTAMGDEDPAGVITRSIPAVLRQSATSAPSTHDDGLLGGMSGAVLALMVLERRGWTGGREWVAARAEQLTRSAARYADPLSLARDLRSDPPLTGLSHGAAAAALALYELFARTGDGAYLAAARGAVDYETELFDDVEENWRDLRVRPQRAGEGARRYSVAWCHGAPGIALSRIQAMSVDAERSERYRDEARIALRTTRRSLEQAFDSEAWDATVCHGVSGLIETVLLGGLTLQDRTLEAFAEESAMRLLLASPNHLRSGTLCGGRNPSLMLGDAGRGYLLLRLHDRTTVPTLLTGALGLA